VDAHCRVGAYYALLAAREQCGAPVPDEVIATLRPSAWRRKWIAATLDPKRFPLSRIPEAQVGRIRARLTVPLLDRPSDWGGVLARYLFVRFLDLVERPRER